MYRLRVGDYRVVYEVDSDALLITIQYVRHHPALSPRADRAGERGKGEGELNRNRLAFFEDAEGGEMQLVEFAHDFFLVGRLEMIGVDRDIRATELAEFLCKQGGREVLADSGQFVLAIRIGTFDERRLEVRSLSGHGPQVIGHIRVPAVQDGSPLIANDESRGWDSVVHENGSDLEVFHAIGFSLIDGLAHEDGRLRARDREEVGIDRCVEDVLFQSRDDFGKSGNRHGCGRVFAEVVGEGREALNVIEMQVRKEDESDLLLLFEEQLCGDGACVEENRAVQEEAAGVAFPAPSARLQPTVRSVTTKDSYLHECAPCCFRSA